MVILKQPAFPNYTRICQPEPMLSASTAVSMGGNELGEDRLNGMTVKDLLGCKVTMSGTELKISQQPEAEPKYFSIGLEGTSLCFNCEGSCPAIEILKRIQDIFFPAVIHECGSLKRD